MAQIQSSDPIPADVLATLGVLDIDVDRIAGDEAWALCPAHEAETGRPDSHASWSINLNTGAHHCFSCGWGGPFVRLVKFVNDWDDEKSAAWVRRRGGIEVARRKITGEGGYKRKEADEVTEADLALFEDPPERALRDKDVDLESCQVFGVRYVPNTERWIFPIRDPHTSKLLGWQEKGKGFFRNHPEHVEKARTVFGYHLLSGVNTAYLEEAPVDAVRLHTYSLDGAVSGYGVHVSEKQMSLLADEVDTLYVCLDNDAAGRARERRIWRECRGMFKYLFFANYEHTDKKDHGEMTPDEIAYSIDSAVSSLRFRD